MELLSSAFDSELRKNAYPLLESLQDQLGSINDHAAAIVRIQHWIAECEDSKKAKYLSQMLERERAELKESRRTFSEWWTRERRKKMRSAFDHALSGSGSRKTA